MKRFLLIPALIYPYLIALSVLGLYSGHVPGDSIFLPLLILAVLWLVGLPMSAAYSLIGITMKANPISDARDVMILRLVQIPAYLFILVVGLMSMITIFTVGITVALIAFCVTSRILSGVAGISAAVGAVRRVDTPIAVTCGVLGFLWLADVISAVILHTKLCKIQDRLSSSDKI